MICEETIEIVHSNLIYSQVFSVEEPDYRVIEGAIRITEESEPRETEDNNLRELE